MAELETATPLRSLESASNDDPLEKLAQNLNGKYMQDSILESHLLPTLYCILLEFPIKTGLSLLWSFLSPLVKLAAKSLVSHQWGTLAGYKARGNYSWFRSWASSSGALSLEAHFSIGEITVRDWELNNAREGSLPSYICPANGGDLRFRKTGSCFSHWSASCGWEPSVLCECGSAVSGASGTGASSILVKSKCSFINREIRVPLRVVMQNVCPHNYGDRDRERERASPRLIPPFSSMMSSLLVFPPGFGRRERPLKRKVSEQPVVPLRWNWTSHSPSICQEKFSHFGLTPLPGGGYFQVFRSLNWNFRSMTFCQIVSPLHLLPKIVISGSYSYTSTKLQHRQTQLLALKPQTPSCQLHISPEPSRKLLCRCIGMFIVLVDIFVLKLARTYL